MLSELHAGSVYRLPEEPKEPADAAETADATEASAQSELATSQAPSTSDVAAVPETLAPTPTTKKAQAKETFNGSLE
jgi:hypothetical protein